jgi:hypothetical protein
LLLAHYQAPARTLGWTKALTSPPYTYQWDSSTVALGAHIVSAQAVDAKGFVGTAIQASITVSLQLGSIVVDQIARADGSGTVNTTPLSTLQPGEGLIASAGAADGGALQTLTITGGGLSWSLVKRANAQFGTSEARTATAGTTVTLNDTAPTADRWNFVGLEVLAAGSPPPPDTTPPSVSITNPLTGQMLSSSVTVAANATDNVAVASGRFLLDNQPLGAPVSVSPYSIVWDSATTTNSPT